MPRHPQLRLVSVLMLGGILATAAAARAAASDEWPSYRPGPAASGVIRSWGHGFLRPVMKLWEAGFQKYHPGVRFDDRLVTSAAAVSSQLDSRPRMSAMRWFLCPNRWTSGS